MHKQIACLAIGFGLSACIAEPEGMSLQLQVKAGVGECSEVRSISVVPLEVVLDGEIEVSAETTGDAGVARWSATAGRFDDAAATDTVYHCDHVGRQELRYEVSDGQGCLQRAAVRVTCSYSPMCGDGHVDIGEECDDGNQRRGDGCSEHCLRKPVLYTPLRVLPWR